MEKLYKKEEGKKLCGVCAGLAECLKIDVSIIRLIWFVAALFGTLGIWIYIGCALILPWKDSSIVEGEKADET